MPTTAVYVIGCGGHAKVVIQAARAAGLTVEALFDDRPDCWGRELLGVTVAGPIGRIGEHGRRPVVLAIGDNMVRKLIAERRGFEWATIIHPRAFVDPSARVGPGTVVLAGAIVQADARIGSHVILNTACTVDHDCVVGDFAHLAPGVHLAGGVRIGEGAFLGTGAVAVPRVHIGDWTTVGAGAAVVGDLPPATLAVGVPARVRTTDPQ